MNMVILLHLSIFGKSSTTSSNSDSVNNKVMKKKITFIVNKCTKSEFRSRAVNSREK